MINVCTLLYSLLPSFKSKHNSRRFYFLKARVTYIKGYWNKTKVITQELYGVCYYKNTEAYISYYDDYLCSKKM
jgi:hypothetical protein